VVFNFGKKVRDKSDELKKAQAHLLLVEKIASLENFLLW